MKLTNNYDLPEVFFQAIKNDKYSRGGADYSASNLINTPRIFHLTQRHWNEIEEDVSDRMWALLGKAVHAILDDAKSENALQEERVFIDILGKSISGQSDIYQDETIRDYKVTSVWTAVYKSREKEWEKQLNIYAYLFRSIGFTINKLEIITIYRDWSESVKLRSGPDYPERQTEVIKINLWPEEKQLEYIKERVSLFSETETLSDNELPFCSQDDTWQKQEKYAVMKEGRKSAVRVFDTESEAQEIIDAAKPADKKKMSIQHRPGERVRCERFCNVSQFCNQYQDWKYNNE